VSPKEKIQPEPLFGINITPSASGADNAFEIAKTSDNLGIDLISVQDHPYNGSFFDTWTLITALAMSTKNIHFMTNVADIPLRASSPTGEIRGHLGHTHQWTS
jgi:alkanesulfonate monooxygenase SsuD/methylene tetrahydromethanopterin reductase-like flavin-dependent oxidoreductase (luciferase family)